MLTVLFSVITAALQGSTNWINFESSYASGKQRWLEYWAVALMKIGKDFENASGSAMINRLGWKATVRNQESLSDSDCSVE